MVPYRCLLIVLALSSTGAEAQVTTPVPPGAGAPSLAERAARRFPQPVRVGDLIDRQVLQPTEAQHVLGRVAAIIRGADGGIEVIVRLGGVYGIGTRPIAVPVEAVALLGEYVAVMDFTPQQLRAFPTAREASSTQLAPDDVVRVGLVGPFH
jgi:hypothetical protein